MRRFASVVARGVAAVSLVVMLASDASAAFMRQQPGEEPSLVARIIHMIKKSVRGLGDGIITPRP